MEICWIYGLNSKPCIQCFQLMLGSHEIANLQAMVARSAWNCSKVGKVGEEYSKLADGR